MKKWISRFLFAFLLWFYSPCYAIDHCPRLTGQVLEKNNADYNQSRLGSNYYTSKNKFPKVIVYCKTV
jgi:hypothetical protein